jgi:L-asparaginase
MKIHILTCGGTIDKVYFDALSEYQVGDPSIIDILNNLKIAFEYEVTQVLREDSLDMDDADRTQVRQAVAASPHDRILITHGTDTMVHTAQAIGDVGGKTVVLTGSMLPGKFSGTDAIFNIGFALAAVQTLAEGVYVCMNGAVFERNEVKKNRKRGMFERKK